MNAGRDPGETSRFSRRIGSGALTSAPASPPAPAGPSVFRFGGPSAWTLRFVLPLLVSPAIFWSLVLSRPGQAVAGVAAIVLYILAGRLVQRGQAAEADYHRRAIARAPWPPMKLLGSLVATLGTLVFALWGARGGFFGWRPEANVPMAVVFAGLTFLGCVLAYGRDPTRHKGLDAEAETRAGVRTDQVIAALAEAEAKIKAIEAAAARLHGTELKSHLRRIVDQARRVIAQLERDPKDLSRARRFLVTYLDGTRDVVAKYAEQQHDLANTPLADNFRRVLSTVEQVFVEQEEILKKDEVLDLDVKIEVLETQLKREGVT
jgi:hypothetical protein